MKRELLALLSLGILAAAPLVAQEAAKADQKPDEPKEEQAVRRAEEVTVESASKVASKLIDAPATMSVVTSETLAAQPAQNMADTLRSVPGMNVIQTSARDINLTARQATSTLATSQLVTVDGRSVYLDFFGLVLWDLVPSPTSGEIKQIEVVRGPASVVWGANAVNGVVNIITKTPRENEGLGLVLGGGLFDRDEGSRESEGNGYQFNGSFSYANAINDTWSYRLNGGYFNSDPYSRPVGTVPLDCHPLGVDPCRTATGAAVSGGFPIGGAAFPADADQPGAFENDGTSQPKFGLRFDQDFSNGGRMTYESWLLRHRGDHPHRDRAVPPGERVVHGVRSRGVHQGRAADQCLRQLPGRRGAEPARVRPGHPGSDRPRVQDPDLRPRGREHERAGREAHPDLRRQPAAEQLRHLARPGRRPHGVRRLRAVGVLRRQVPHRGGRPRRQVRQPRRPRLLPPPQPHVQAHARPLDPGLLQPGLRVAVLHQQLPGPEHPVPPGRSTSRRSSPCSGRRARSSRRPSCSR